MLIHKAIEFATVAHKEGKRKGTDIPYIVHPVEVALILQKEGCDEEVVVAGLLHDTVEDTTTTLDQIRKEFGDRVANLVASCSENKNLSWEERKQHTIDYLNENADYEYLQLSCADKLSNLRSIYADYSKLGDELWTRFRRGKEQQKWYYGNLIEAFKVLGDCDMCDELEELYAKVF